MPGEADRFVIDSLHQIAVAGDDEGAVVDDAVAVDRIQVPLSDRHSDRHRHALTQRAGRDLDSRKLEILRMAGAGAAELPKALDVVERRAGVAGEVKKRVDQHRPVARRQDETVAVRPVRVGRVELQVLREQCGRGVGHAHRHPRMAAVGGLHRVHRECANGVGEAALGRLHGSPRAGFGSAQGMGGSRAPLEGEPWPVNACPESRSCVADKAMDDGGLSAALDRAERAFQRIERTLATREAASGRDEELRARVREAVAELDRLIREAAQ